MSYAFWLVSMHWGTEGNRLNGFLIDPFLMLRGRILALT
jgi:hypothetical protein